MQESNLEETKMSNTSKISTKKKIFLPSTYIHLQTVTWMRESYGLFDYQCSEDKLYKEPAFAIEEPSIVYRGPKSRRTYVHRVLNKYESKIDQSQYWNEEKAMVKNASNIDNHEDDGQNQAENSSQGESFVQSMQQYDQHELEKAVQFSSPKTRERKQFARRHSVPVQSLEGLQLFGIEYNCKTRRYNLVNLVQQTADCVEIPKVSNTLEIIPTQTQSLQPEIKLTVPQECSNCKCKFSPQNPLHISYYEAINRSSYRNRPQIQGKLFRVLDIDEGVTINPGDYLKMGRVEFRVLQIQSEFQKMSIDCDRTYGAKQNIFVFRDLIEGQCKICLGTQTDYEDPLISPCNCKGSCGLIHLQCLKTWINNKVKVQRQGYVITYNFDKFSCEICKVAFPSMVRIEQTKKQYNMLDFKRPEEDETYLMLEQCCQTEQSEGKTVHFVMAKKDIDVKIGRTTVCSLVLNDISVSRLHARIAFDGEDFKVFDCGSKFGTLVQIKESIDIRGQVKVQFEGCYFKLTPKPIGSKSRVEVQTIDDDE